jgi:glucose-6-phosphate dehydrogenase assembly protein OpcA
LSETTWSAEGTTPAAVEAALRELLKERHAEVEAFVPARVLNLVVVIDAAAREEIEGRLDRVGRYHPSRAVLVVVEEGRTAIDASASVGSDEGAAGDLVLGRERVSLTVGERHLEALDSLVDPIVVTDLATVVWAPGRHAEAVDSLTRLAQVVLVDSVSEPEPTAALERASELAERSYVVDLAWLRGTPWRERIASTFDPAPWRDELRSIRSVEVRYRPDSAAAALLLVGWLCARLGWEPVPAGDGRTASATRTSGDGDGDVELRLEPEPAQEVPGLAGISIATASGMSIALDRGPGGLSARRRAPDGAESRWTVLGASRGESGILGEGIRQALLRDPTYAPALAGARRLAA